MAGSDRGRSAALDLRGWLAGSGALPTTLAGAEMCILVAFLGLRLTDLLQLAIAVPTGLHRSTNAPLDAALMLCYLLESIGIATAVCRRRRFFSSTWASVDVATAVVILLSEPAFTASSDRIGTWTAWGYAISIGAAFAAGIGYPGRVQTCAAAAVLAGCYVGVSLSDAGSRGLSGTVWSNTIAYAGFALFPRALASFLRRLGREADRAREQASQAGQQAERDRQRRLLHDHETVMRMLAAPTLDPALAALIRGQAITAANQVRSLLNDPRHAPRASTDRLERTLLGELVVDAVAGFGDLPIELSVDLAYDVQLDTAVGQALISAVQTLLHNARRHANATSIVVHADRSDDYWELVIRDDGIGFNPASVAFGFGLREIVLAHPARHGIDVRIESAPAQGTAVTLTGPAQ